MDGSTARETWERMTELTAGGRLVRNFQAQIRMDDYTVETSLFPVAALEAYSAWNLEADIPLDARRRYFSAHRGGSQGDYRIGMARKIANVVDCLKKYPLSKRAVITIANNPSPEHSADDDAKCMREIHFYLDGLRLNATVLFRAQAAEIFPKNIHFIGSLMEEISNRLGGGVVPGDLFYLATCLVSDRA